MLTIGNKHLNSKGLTLIEVIIAMTILSVISIGLISMMTATLTVMYDYGDRTENTLDSQEVMEESLGLDVVTPSATETFNFNGVTVTVTGEEVSNGEITIFNPQ